MTAKGFCGGQSDVVLVLMPYADICRPSLALGLLQAALAKAGIQGRVEYANLRFAEESGWPFPEPPNIARLLGEWVFSRAAFPSGPAATPGEFFAKLQNAEAGLPGWVFSDPRFFAALERLREKAEAFVGKTARMILGWEPKIVGFSSTFEQHCASLALARKLKEIDPSVATVFGGANCVGELGWGTLKHFPWVDYVASGEADESFPLLCRRLLEGGGELAESDLPAGIFGRAMLGGGRKRGGGGAARGIVRSLDGLPTPDYSDYFRQVSGSPLREKFRPGLMAETSRGCWWGEKSHCTFCGLNGEGMSFRSKSAGRAAAELEELSARWGLRDFMIVDNILEMRYFRDFFPLLPRGEKYRLFYETKANLRREQVRALREAGVEWVQPGIESFHDGLLSLMGKGNHAAMNVALLKYARESGIHVTWLLLFLFPGEDDAWHEEVAGWLPAIFHFQPPRCAGRVLFDRFSSYQKTPEIYGLRLRPAKAYGAIYPAGAEGELAYFFEDEKAEGRLPSGAAKLARFAVEWNRLHERALKPVLSEREVGGAIEFFDTRPCAVERRQVLRGAVAEVYRACEPPISVGAIEGRLEKCGSEISRGEVAECIAFLKSRFLVLEVCGKLVSLGVPGDSPAICRAEDFPGGSLHAFPSLSREKLEAFFVSEEP